MIVDWRNRFGRNWITTVRNQGGTVNCWAFATTALYEAMIRIEHCLWTRRSEGDVARGAGKEGWDFGNSGEAIRTVEAYGLPDPDCFPWSPHVSLYVAKPHGPAASAIPISPTPDRVGRVMRVGTGSSTSMTTAAQKKAWIDTTGPMAMQIDLPASFAAYGSGVYMHRDGEARVGGHVMLVVGFNDDERCWIVKNSWGPAWGEQGFIRMSYDRRDAMNNVVAGGGLLEDIGFVGVRGTNPDPWARRRQRTGVFVQGGNGARRNNFEVFLRTGTNLSHWFRENSAPGQPWAMVSDLQPRDPYDRQFGSDAVDCPAAVQSSFNRDFELVYRTQSQRLRHVYWNQSSGWWNDADWFGPPDPVGIPGFIQGNRGAPGDFEVVVVTQGGQAEHWTKHNGGPWNHLPGEWYLKERFGSAFRHGGPGLVQSKLGVIGSPENGQGELHFVGAVASGSMEHWRRTGTSAGTLAIQSQFGSGVTSAPCLIEGTYGAGNEMNPGNFELCVAVGGRIEHWWRHNASLSAWNQSAVFGEGVRRVVGLLQSSFGTNLELIAERTDGRFFHYWRDGAGWHAGSVII
jgi:hypothetical protein